MISSSCVQYSNSFHACFTLSLPLPISCVRIVRTPWVFDESLRNKDSLIHIFEVMTFDNNNYLLWCEGHNEIIFYPLSERYAAIEYFANAFLKE